MSDKLSNFTLRDEIKEYWSLRAETFDQSAGHEIFSEKERNAWHQLIIQHLGKGNGRFALDMASGTGVISHLLYDLGFQTTGLDWSDAMLVKARKKSIKRQSNIKFIVGDAEKTMQPLGTFDVITNRHLVWTLVDPISAIDHWFELLKSGGKILIVDGDFKTNNFVRKALKKIIQFTSIFNKNDNHGRSPAMMETHNRILEQVYFKNGLTSVMLAKVLLNAGFVDIYIQTDLSKIHKAQAKGLGFMKYLDRTVQHRFAISATKP